MSTSLKAGAVYKPDALVKERMFEQDGPPPDYYWCLHCERAYRRGEFRLIGNLQMCPYADCDGDAVGDAWDWGSIRRDNGYPEVPVEGAVYPMYDPSK